MTTQIAVKLPDALVAGVDALVGSGAFVSRSEAVRSALHALLRAQARADVDQAYADAYQRMPVTDAELADAVRLGIESVEDEPWERWW